MWLISNGSDIRVHPQRLQQGSGPPFLHADNDGLGKFLHSVIRRAVHEGEFALRGAGFLALLLQHRAVKRLSGRRRLRPSPLRRPLFCLLGMVLGGGGRGGSQRLRVHGEALGGGIKFLPQCHRSCLLRRQPALIDVVLLQRELQRVVAAQQAVKQVSDREGEGKHE